MNDRSPIAVAKVPDTEHELRLYRIGADHAIRIMGKGELMNTRAIGTERALAELACARLASRDHARVLVGGLGMGFTLAAALELLGPNAEAVVAELVPEVVEWNRTHVGDAAGHPLRDPRTAVHVGDVAEQIRDPGDGFDAIMLDVDNGPEAILRRENNWLYGSDGLAGMRAALRSGGTLAIWSAGPDRTFTLSLQRAGFRVSEHSLRAHRSSKGKGKGKGPRHHAWLAN